MILNEKYLKKLIKGKKARYTNETESESLVTSDGKRFVIVERLDKIRVDHYVIE